VGWGGVGWGRGERASERAQERATERERETERKRGERERGRERERDLFALHVGKVTEDGGVPWLQGNCAEVERVCIFVLVAHLARQSTRRVQGLR